TIASAMSNLAINERASAGSPETQIQDHRNRHAKADDVGLEALPEARLVAELVAPDPGHQDQHERGHLRIMPCRREDAACDQQRIVQRACPEEDPGEANKDEHA